MNEDATAHLGPPGYAPVQVASWNAAIVDDIAGARAAIEAGWDVKGFDTRRALNYATWRNDTTMIETLLEVGAGIDLANRSGFMPLQHAVVSGGQRAGIRAGAARDYSSLFSNSLGSTANADISSSKNLNI